jgi:hypothetical protein
MKTAIVEHRLFAVAILLATIFTSAGVLPAEESVRPNLLIMIADDLCWRDLGYQGHPDVKTPNLDRLASEGMRLERMFNPAATCSPTRNALYSGLHCIRSGAFPNHTRLYDGTKSIFSHLKEMGYRVALQNKGHVGPFKSYPYESISGADDLTETTGSHGCFPIAPTIHIRLGIAGLASHWSRPRSPCLHICMTTRRRDRRWLGTSMKFRNSINRLAVY